MLMTELCSSFNKTLMDDDGWTVTLAVIRPWLCADTNSHTVESLLLETPFIIIILWWESLSSLFLDSGRAEFEFVVELSFKVKVRIRLGLGAKDCPHKCRRRSVCVQPGNNNNKCFRSSYLCGFRLCQPKLWADDDTSLCSSLRHRQFWTLFKQRTLTNLLRFHTEGRHQGHTSVFIHVPLLR